MKTMVLFILFIGNVTLTIAQPHKKEIRNLQFGIKAGAVYSKITGLDKVLVSESYYSGYSFDNPYSWGFTAGVYVNYKFEESISALYTELSYSRLANLLEYSDVNDFKYDFTARYEFVTWELFYRVYVWNGLHFGIGPRIGFNLTPDALFYKSNGEDIYGPDLREQQDLRDILKGRSNFSLGVSVGYELANGLSLDFRYYHGFSDVIETQVNNHHLIETKNASRVFQVTLGYALPYNLKFH
ncbi:MAG TPA: porin family protein [Bacteroidales bacterium]|nr:porin family protein [Bacteroidales bacterium]